MSGQDTIKVLVSPLEGDDHARVISFPYPERIAASKWLDFDIPIDGGGVTFVVGRNEEGKYHYPDFQSGRWVTLDWDADLAPTLAAAERSLIDFLKKSGYEVEF